MERFLVPSLGIMNRYSTYYELQKNGKMAEQEESDMQRDL